jgi:hypothetical protein
MCVYVCVYIWGDIHTCMRVVCMYVFCLCAKCDFMYVSTHIPVIPCVGVA